MTSHLALIPRVLMYKLARLGLIKSPRPINLTFSVTNMCQSRCKTCSIWRLYRDEPARYRDELSLDEIEQIFQSMGETYFFNISGGEPFLRKDLPEIVSLACKHLKPAVIHTPTNALAPDLVERGVVGILDAIRQSGHIACFTIKPSFDGVGDTHDDIRGVRGNFDKALDTLSRLKKLQEQHSNLEVGLGTIISKFNLDYIGETVRLAGELGVDSYISEIAEERTELFNMGQPITPTAEEYERAIETFNAELDRGPSPTAKVSATTLAFRQVYYSYAVRIMREKRQVLPCYGGISNVHISPYGDVWPCCVLGYAKSMGNLRDYGYDFMRIWRSSEAGHIRRFIAGGGCYCPLANQAYSNILCSAKGMLQFLRVRGNI